MNELLLFLAGAVTGILALMLLRLWLYRANEMAARYRTFNKPQPPFPEDLMDPGAQS